MVQRAMTRRQFVRGSAASLAGLSLAAATGSAGAAPIRGGTLTIGRSIDAGSLDLFQDSSAPASWVYGLIYEPLVTLSPSMQVQPGLASSWRVTSPTRARFMLRRGVKFHDGTPCDAAAIKFNFDRTFNPQKPGIWAAFAGPIKGAEIVDDYTVDVVTTEPFAPLLLNLSMVHGGMASPAAVRQYGADYGRHPVGTGPFKFVEWVPRDHITVARNDGYWGDKTPLDSIVFKVIPDDSARMIALRTGDADMVLNPLAEELPALRRDPAYTVAGVVGTRTVFLSLTLTQPPMDDVRIRRALIVGTNRASIAQNIVQSDGAIDDSVMAPSIVGYAPMHLDRLYSYDPKAARALLAAAGFQPGSNGIMARGGSPLVLSMLSPRGRYPKDAEISQAFQAQMRDIGVQVDLQIPDYPIIVSALRSATLNTHILMTAWGNLTGDGDFTLVPLFKSDQVPPTGWNTCRYLNPEFDKLAAAQRVSLNPTERAQLDAQAQQLLARDLPVLPFYNANNIAAMRSYVKGFVPHPVEYDLRVAPVWLQK
jgi:ABC-type transport system substrate-binding protein